MYVLRAIYKIVGTHRHARTCSEFFLTHAISSATLIWPSESVSICSHDKARVAKYDYDTNIDS